MTALWLKNGSGSGENEANVDEAVAEGVVLVLYGWPGEANVNVLTDAHYREAIMGYPQMKSLLC